jgi:hypothetical protein
MLELPGTGGARSALSFSPPGVRLPRFSLANLLWTRAPPGGTG